MVLAMFGLLYIENTKVEDKYARSLFIASWHKGLVHNPMCLFTGPFAFLLKFWVVDIRYNFTHIKEMAGQICTPNYTLRV